jgi:Type II secretion system protein C
MAGMMAGARGQSAGPLRASHCLLVTGALVVAVPVVFAARDAGAQTAAREMQAMGSRFVAEEWRLRGVVLAEPARFAVLQHGASSRLQLFRVGDVVEGGVAVASITADRVVLDAQGRAITLRLAHGGDRVSGRRPVPHRWPPAIVNRGHR